MQRQYEGGVMRYDVAIVGTGPAGLSAALNLKIHNKNIIWFGSKELSMKVERSERISNYPGTSSISGPELNAAFNRQIEEAGLEITDRMVTSIMPMGKGFMLLGGSDVYEADRVLLATGTVQAKELPGEAELLGRGVSYCATCDGALYKGKRIAVICGAKRYEHEVEFLSELADTVYLFAQYSDCDIELPNVERLSSPITEIRGKDKSEGGSGEAASVSIGIAGPSGGVSSVITHDGKEIDVDGVFILRTAVAPTSLLKTLELDGTHIAVSRNMQTSVPGVYAAGDCTGRPYQIAKAAGEGNIAAHAIIESLKME